MTAGLPEARDRGTEPVPRPPSRAAVSAPSQTGDVPLEALQPVEVEVVRGLVEQEDVVARQQQRRQAGAGGLAAGQRRHRHVERDPERHVVRNGSRTLVEVRAAEGEPAVERGGVGVVRTGRAGPQRLRGGVHRRLGVRDAGPAGEERDHGLAGAPVGFLRQVPDRGRRRADGHRALLRSGLPGEDAQQRRLAGAVRPHEADDVTRGEHEVETGEQDAGAVSGGQAGGLDGGTHLQRTVPGVTAGPDG